MGLGLIFAINAVGTLGYYEDQYAFRYTLNPLIFGTELLRVAPTLTILMTDGFAVGLTWGRVAGRPTQAHGSYSPAAHASFKQRPLSVLDVITLRTACPDEEVMQTSHVSNHSLIARTLIYLII